jgi:hypothetical protein
MDKIGPKEAADVIRDEFDNEHVDPRFHHQVRFAGDVLSEMGKEKTIENTAKVMRLLTKHDIEGHSYSDYPKWVQNERGERAVVNDEDHEAEFMARPAPHDDKGLPNPEHGHVDPQSGVFVAGMKPVVYDRSEFDKAAPDIHDGDPEDLAATRNREFSEGRDRAETDRRLAETEIHDNLHAGQAAAAGQVNTQGGQQASAMGGWKPDPVQNRAEQIKAEQAAIAAADQAAKDGRARMAAMEKEPG